MKPVDITFKKIEVNDYYSQLDQVKIRILFNDGKDKALEKQLTIKTPELHVQEFLKEIRTKLKQQHSVTTLDDDPLAATVVLRFTQETDIVEEKMTRFLSQVNERIRSGKLAKLSYWDMEKKVKGFAAQF
ncbi:hypothetical protein J4219_06700 [Candidatus Woesearchaeota archaeon]|nr:hypothetical protein [Candidatus Woesearchaeota archaeon]